MERISNSVSRGAFTVLPTAPPADGFLLRRVVLLEILLNVSRDIEGKDHSSDAILETQIDLDCIDLTQQTVAAFALLLHPNQATEGDGFRRGAESLKTQDRSGSCSSPCCCWEAWGISAKLSPKCCSARSCPPNHARQSCCVRPSP